MILEGKTAVVTGVSSGLGKAIAESLVKEKLFKIYGIARNTEALSALHQELGSFFIPVVLDITDEKRVRAWVQHTFDKSHVPDILINNAGVGAFARIDEMSSHDWLNIINTNINGLYFISSEIIKLLRKKKEPSHIINIGSIMGTTTRPEGSAYGASKFAVNAISETLFKELREDNIKVTCVNPGSIETDFLLRSGIAPIITCCKQKILPIRLFMF